VHGSYALYGGDVVQIGWPPSWHRNPFTGEQRDPTPHWSRLRDHLPTSDLKDVWELSRMGWVGSLLRAYALTGDDRWPAAFWDAVADWRSANPPYRGSNWMSGQEVALRGISLMTGLAGFADHPSSSPDRVALVGGVLRDSVSRVLATLGYAQSQRNNHAVSEAAFLYSVAVICPPFPKRDRVLRRAQRALSEAVDDQFGADGSYAQHSFTYQRLALHGLLWARWASVQSGVALDCRFEEIAAASARLLESLLDERTGRLPNTGGNDGALVFRLSDCEIGDFRPLLVHLAAATRSCARVASGAWDEEATWFGLAVTRAEGATPSPRTPAETAYHALRGPSSHALLRAGKIRHRPAHADQLHVDLWAAGVNVARDPGTYRYTAPSPWQNALTGDDVHNVPRLDGVPSARRAGRFFWIDWQQATVVLRLSDKGNEVVIAELQPRSDSNALIRRLLARIGDSYVIADHVSPNKGAVRWNLPLATAVDCDGGLTRAIGAGFAACLIGDEAGSQQLHPRDDDPVSGWESLTYGERSPLVPVVVRTRPDGTALAAFAPDTHQLLLPGTADDWARAVMAASEKASRAALAAGALLLGGA
jgi:hypothetical protein